MPHFAQATAKLTPLLGTGGQITKSFRKVGRASPQEPGQTTRGGLHGDARRFGLVVRQAPRDDFRERKRSSEKWHQPRVTLDQALPRKSQYVGHAGSEEDFVSHSLLAMNQNGLIGKIAAVPGRRREFARLEVVAPAPFVFVPPVLVIAHQ